MIRELWLKNFRAFRSLHLSGLGRVNLLVGANNSGKTSVLEGVALIASEGDPTELFDAQDRRSEHGLADDDVARASPSGGGVDVRHLFFGRRIDDDSISEVSAIGSDERAVNCRLSTPRVKPDQLPEWRAAVLPRRSRRRPEAGEQVQFEFARAGRIPRYLTIEFSDRESVSVALLPNGTLSHDYNPSFEAADDLRGRPVVFIPTSGLGDDVLARIYDPIVLTPEEETVVEALRFVEPGIRRLATREGFPYNNRGFVVGMDGTDPPIPLGSLGDGVHRILAIVLPLVAARGGYLLIDEIDTGLHHTVLRRVWRLVFETAKRLDVTVFATTHSSDCVHALAEIAQSDGTSTDGVSLIRIERDNPEGVSFTEEEIRHLAEWQIEAR